MVAQERPTSFAASLAFDRIWAALAAMTLSYSADGNPKTASPVTCVTHGSVTVEGILETAKARTCDLIVMASHGRRGLTRVLLGSQAHNVVTHSTIPVLICR
jgi:nucleotide-binding universal stress UspA family protein